MTIKVYNDAYHFFMPVTGSNFSIMKTYVNSTELLIKQKKVYVMNNTSKIIIAAAAGVLAGVIAGVLFAPAKGSETRKKIDEESKKFTGNIKDKFRKGKEQISNLKEDIEQFVKEKVDEFA